MERLCHVAPETTVIAHCKCLSCFLVSVVLFKACMEWICVQIMTWSKETRVEVHFAMHMSSFWWQNQTEDVWTVYLQPMDSFILSNYHLPSTLVPPCHLWNTAQAVCNVKRCKITLPASNNSAELPLPWLVWLHSVGHHSKNTMHVLGA